MKTGCDLTEEEKSETRRELESTCGQVWNTEELTQDYTVVGFCAPFVQVERKSDDATGTLEFMHMPRFY